MLHAMGTFDLHINLPINKKLYKLWVADSREKQVKGLSGLKDIPDDHGMIFIYSKPVLHNFTMENTHIPLNIIFLDENFNTIETFKCEPLQKEPIAPKSKFSYI